MAPHDVKNDHNRTVATVRTHGRAGWIEVKARRRWTAADARNVAAALIAAADAAEAPARPTPPPQAALSAVSIPVPVAALSSPVEPPRAGRGASLHAWATFARRLGVTVTDEMSRNEIIAACDNARDMAPA